MEPPTAAVHPWPLFALRLRTPLLELRLPHDDDIVALAEAGAGGILDERERNFMGPWSRLPDGEFQRGFWRRQWAWRAEWTPAKWVLDLAVYPVGEPRPVGCAGLMATDFATTRVVRTGSWLLPAWRGRGLGRQMRTALLHLAFRELGALEAHSAAHPDNAASRAVSRALGYEDNGTDVLAQDGERVPVQLARCDPDSFIPACEVQVEGIDACRAMFGV